MKFASGEETFMAMVVVTRWLPELLGRIESGVTAMGIVIEKKATVNYPDGEVDPVLILRGRRGWHLELHLRNAMEDFLTLDRDGTPVRLDPRLSDKEFAEKKLGEVVQDRLTMVRAINESSKVGDVARKIEKSKGMHGTCRIWEYNVCDLAGEDGAGGKERR